MNSAGWRGTLSLARGFLVSPVRSAAAARRPESLAPGLWIYLAFMAAYLVFFWLKPWDFPDRNAPFPRENQGLFFWFKVILWQPPLETAWIVFLMGLLVWFQTGFLALKLAAATAWAAGPFVLMAAYVQKDGISKSALAAGSLACAALFYPLLRRAPPWRPLVSFMLGLNAIGLALLVPMTAAVLIDSPELFKFSQVAGGLWILGAGTLGLRELTGLRLPRAFMAVLLSMFFQIAFAFTLHLLGVVPKDILKALLYA